MDTITQILSSLPTRVINAIIIAASVPLFISLKRLSETLKEVLLIQRQCIEDQKECRTAIDNFKDQYVSKEKLADCLTPIQKTLDSICDRILRSKNI